MTQPRVGILVGSESDLPVMQKCLDVLADYGIEGEIGVASAHRAPDVVHAYVSRARPPPCPAWSPWPPPCR